MLENGTARICNIKPIQQTKLQKMAKNLFFWLFGSLKIAKLRFLNDPSWPGNVAESWKTFSTITICNIKSIQHTKLKKIAEKLFFDLSDHSKMHFCDLWMILHDMARLPNDGKHFNIITICNIKSIQQCKLQKMVIFGSMDHSKMHFRDVWIILHDLVTLLNVKNI